MKIADLIRIYRIMAGAAVIATLAAAAGSLVAWNLGMGSIYLYASILWIVLFIVSLKELRWAYNKSRKSGRKSNS